MRSASIIVGMEERGADGVVRRGMEGYDWGMTLPGERATDVSVRQFAADSGAVTRGLRQGRTYTLTLNGEPLARMIPIRRRRAVPKEEVLAILLRHRWSTPANCVLTWTGPWARIFAIHMKGPACDGARRCRSGHQHHRRV